MTAIQRLPEEVLQIIFKNLIHYDVLQYIILETAADYKRFEKSIKHNPSTYYLNAVQKIIVGLPEDVYCYEINELTKDLLGLIVRFPRLKSVDIHGHNSRGPPAQLKDVDKDAIAKSCPKLERVNIDATVDSEDNYFDLLYKLRHTLTFMPLNLIRPNYLTDFPHLQGTIGYSSEFNKLLTLIDNIPALKDITLMHKHEHESFAEEYLSAKSKDERDLVVKRLSKITAFKSTLQGSPFCVNIATFILRYLTGLKSLSLSSSIDSVCNDQQHDLFCRLLEYARTLESFSISLNLMQFDGLSRCFEPALLMVESYKTDKLKHTYLELFLMDDRGDMMDAGDIDIRLIQDRHYIKLHVTMNISTSIEPQQIIDLFESISSLDHIHTFILNSGGLLRYQGFTSVYDDTFKTITGLMSSLKEVVLDIPTVLGEQLKIGRSVTSLTLRLDTFSKEKLVLKNYISLFPKLEDLQLFYVSGVWEEDLHEFQINLGLCNLRKLTVDLTNVKDQMEDYSQSAFIVIEFKAFENCKRRLFKIPMYLLGTTEINDASLEGLTRGKDYIVVHVTVNSLQCFDIFTCRREREGLYSGNYGLYYNRRESDDIRYVNLFSDKDVPIM